MAAKRFKLSEDDAAMRVRKLVDVDGSASWRRPFERTALKNRLFFIGKQWFVEEQGTGLFREPRISRSGRVNYKANLIVGNVLRSILTVTGANGEFVVPPKKSTRAAEKAAWVSTKLFEHMSQMVGMRELDQLACLMAAIDGSVIWKIHWNPERGDKTRYYKPKRAGGKAMVDLSELEMQQLEESGEYEDVPAGDVDVDLVPLFQFYWDWRARDRGLMDAKWCATCDLVRRDTLREEYGKIVDDISPSDGTESQSNRWHEWLAFTTGNFVGANYEPEPTGDRDDDWVMRVQFWEVPLPSNGMLGRFIVMGGDKVLENRDNRYRDTGHPLPFVRQNWITVPGRFWGKSLVEELTSPQRQYNAARSKKIQQQNSFGQPWVSIPKGWEIPDNFITQEPGAVLRHNANAGGKIEIGPTPILPKEVSENAIEARSEMAEISSQQSLDSSKLPGQIRSGAGLELMMEERNKQLIHPAENFLLAKEGCGRQMLALGRKRYAPERVLHYVGADRKYRVQKFFTADIDADLRVMLDRGKLLTSPAAMRARVQESVQLGILNPAMNPDDREAVLRAMEFNAADHIASDRLQEEENQEREIDEMVADPAGWMQPRADMMAPQQVGEDGLEVPRVVQGYPTNLFDDDAAHIRILLRFMRSSAYRDLDPLTQSLILSHLQEHQSKEQQRMMEQLAMQEAIQGSPGQKGEPSKPRQPSIQ